MDSKVARWALLPILLGGVFGLGIWVGPEVTKRITPGSTGPTASETSDRPAYALGKLRPAEGVLLVVGPVGDRVKKILVKEGDHIKIDQPVVELVSVDDRLKELKLAETQLAESEKVLADIQRGRETKAKEIDLQIEGLDTAWVMEDEGHQVKIPVLSKAVDNARSQQRRISSLNPGVVQISAQEHEQLSLMVSKAEGELTGGRIAHDVAKKQYDLNKRNAEELRKVADAEYDLARDRVPLESLKLGVALAKLKVERSTLKAPATGQLLRIVTRAGDTITTGPILEIAAGTGIVVYAEVYAADIARVRGWLQGNGKIKATVTSSATGTHELTGTVSDPEAISNMVVANEVPGLGPRANSDRRVVAVRVEIDKESAEEARRFIGLEVQIKLEPATASNPKSSS